MATITLKGNQIHTVGDLPKVGSKAPDFTLVGNDLSVKSLSDYKGQKLVLNIFPSLDTGTCAASVRSFKFKRHKSTLYFKRSAFCTSTFLWC